MQSQHAIYQWERWLEQPMGQRLLVAEQAYLSSLYPRYVSKFIALIGVPSQAKLLQTKQHLFPILLSPLMTTASETYQLVESQLTHLPIASGSVDLVVLPHSAEHSHSPRQLVAEACRIVKPQGYLIILGFNPMSWWGVKKWPGSLQRLPASQIKKWLRLAEFELISQDQFLYRPPVQSPMLYHQLRWMEWLGRYSHLFFGGIYAIIARAKVVPLTPLTFRWKQAFSSAKTTYSTPFNTRFR